MCLSLQRFVSDQTKLVRVSDCSGVRLCSIEFDYVRLLNYSITKHSIAFDWQNVFVSSIKRAIGFDYRTFDWLRRDRGYIQVSRYSHISINFVIVGSVLIFLKYPSKLTHFNTQLLSQATKRKWQGTFFYDFPLKIKAKKCRLISLETV